MQPPRPIIGIDEAGRGPLAGPIAVGVVLLPVDFDWQRIPGVRDSKQLSARKREEIYAVARALHKTGEIHAAVALVGATTIDRIGIVRAVERALRRGLSRVAAPDDAVVKLDGGLRAPARFLQQETIIKGDQREAVIGLASIMAKVTRDRYMTRKSALPIFAPYEFHRHKGYATKAHRAAIAKYGPSPLHRKTYCKNIALL